SGSEAADRKKLRRLKAISNNGVVLAVVMRKWRVLGDFAHAALPTGCYLAGRRTPSVLYLIETNGLGHGTSPPEPSCFLIAAPSLRHERRPGVRGYDALRHLAHRDQYGARG